MFLISEACNAQCTFVYTAYRSTTLVHLAPMLQPTRPVERLAMWLTSVVSSWCVLMP